MKEPKQYTIVISNAAGEDAEFTKTLEEFQIFFSDILKSANKLNKKIPLDGGKTIKTFVNNLIKADELIFNNWVDRSYIELI